MSDFRSGIVAILGRPNAGKSTLLNRILGRKIAAVTPKPQTTRRRLLGIKTLPTAQLLFIDTPGIHAAHDLLNERMVAQALQSIPDSDAVLWVVDAGEPLQKGDREIAALLPPAYRRAPDHTGGSGRGKTPPPVGDFRPAARAPGPGRW